MVTTNKSLPILPLDIQFFHKIKKDDFLYIDKTGLIAQLINSKLTYFFLSRPRRFGKSLLISTMKEIFSGNKELFKNLQVYNEIHWESYPGVFLSFVNSCDILFALRQHRRLDYRELKIRLSPACLSGFG